MGETEFANMEKFLLEMLEEASALLLRMQGNAAVSNKSWHDLVTEADVASQKLIIGKIKRKYPNHTIFAEEGMDKADLHANDCWVIDPLDGTNNYAYGLPLWGISIGYAKKGELRAGGIAYPNQGIFLIAIKGKGAFEYRLEEGKISSPKRMKVSERRTLKEAMVLVCPAPHSVDGPKNFEKLGRAASKVFSIRQFGAAIYEIGYVAQGLCEVCILFRLKPHDGAAGALLIEEAGGKVTDLDGKKWKLDSPSFVGTNGKFHKEIIEMLE